MKKVIIVLLSCLFLVPAFAQKGKDLVYLKSGGIIKGKLITHDAEKVKINSAGNQWVFNVAEVDSVSKFSRTARETMPIQDYFFDTSLGVLVGNASNANSAPFSFMSSVNYKVYKTLFAGVGLGAESFDETYMPAFAQIQYKFRNEKFTPFINLQAGYQIALEDGNRQHYTDYYSSSSYYWPNPQYNQKIKAEGGILINPSIGFQRFSSDNFGWFFSFGYRYHQLNYSGENGYELEANFSRLSLKIGFIFN